MKTIEINLYSFNELSEEAKQTAINNYRNNNNDNDNARLYDEVHDTVKKFNEVFNITEGRNSYLDFSTSHIDDNVLILTGLRLRKYILNNFGSSLYEGKYFSLWSKTEVSFKYYKDGYPVLKSRYSKIMKENSCVLTGVCYDDDMLQPIYEFIEYTLRPDYNNTLTFEDLINDCFQSIQKSLDNELEYRNSDEFIEGEIEANEMQFTEDGKIY